MKGYTLAHNEVILRKAVRKNQLAEKLYLEKAPGVYHIAEKHYFQLLRVNWVGFMILGLIGIDIGIKREKYNLGGNVRYFFGNFVLF